MPVAHSARPRVWPDHTNPAFRDVGFVHIPRTGGTYASRKLGLAMFEHSKYQNLAFGWWHSAPAPQLMESKKVWFTIVRNPYDRISSELKLAKKTAEDLMKMEIPEYGHFCRQVSLAKYADHICRYETLPKDLNGFLEENGYPKIDLGDFRRRGHPLSDEQKSAIRDRYLDDFREFGYPT